MNTARRCTAFASPGYGPIGHVDGERIVAAPEVSPASRSPEPAPPLPRVDLDSSLRGNRRLFRPGGTRLRRARRSCSREPAAETRTNRFSRAFREAVSAGVPVVVCSRCVAGRVSQTTAGEAGRTSPRRAPCSPATSPGRRRASSASSRSPSSVDSPQAVGAEAEMIWAGPSGLEEAARRESESCPC